MPSLGSAQLYIGADNKRRLICPPYKKLSVFQQCRVIELPRSSYYFKAKEESLFNQRVMKAIDRKFLDCPFYGVERMTMYLKMDLGGDLFEQIHQAIEFVMSQLDFRVGTRAHSEIAPGSYELPREVVAKAVVNAIVHRNYADKGSVEVILYKNRLEISNPGSLPLGWTTERLKQLHNSVPHNPLIAHPMYLTGHIEQLGTGIQDMIHRLKGQGLPEPEFNQEEVFSTRIYRTTPQDAMQDAMQDIMQDTMQVTTAIKNLIKVLHGEMSRESLQKSLDLSDREYFRKAYISEALEGGWIEQTPPDKPTSKNQKYRLTAKGNLLKRNWINETIRHL